MILVYILNMNYHLNHTQLTRQDIPFDPEDWFSELDYFAEFQKATQDNSTQWLIKNYGLSEQEAQVIFRKWKFNPHD